MWDDDNEPERPASPMQMIIGVGAIILIAGAVSFAGDLFMVALLRFFGE